ncbi:hypothetical protein [Myroides sp. WP-1]|uniref:hypothetical protein n=1 Tax=Myroides sp. WP-1 TaxID=2759944 RepID=UPI0015FE135F|nr:hypothetical protein [Myroides sp. WP-1]MBB1140097.1 hypothetical protein [Myroides sp. WP-1]
MKQMNLCYSMLLIMLSFNVFAQKETYNWFYGSGQGITWNRTQTFNGSPIDAPNTTVALTGIPTRYESQSVRPQLYPMSTREGVFSLSDSQGNLLFYSNGSIIYNANHDIMENATELEGHSSSAQSGIIVPFPGNKNKYVAISIGISGENKLAYNILDIEANNGLGKLELPKNRQFELPQGVAKSSFVESLAATKHANGVDYWIISISRAGIDSKMVAWLLTKDGVLNSPITSPIPDNALVPDRPGYGCFKISPNGKYFALVENLAFNLYWGEFNNKTGKFSNTNNYRAIANKSITSYGGEFSPDGNYLYVSAADAENKIAYVFDFNELLLGNTVILKTYAAPTNNYFSGAIQLGPDLRMYMTMSPPSFTDPYPSLLYMFENPNKPLTTKVYALKNLSPGTERGADGLPGTRLGLPNFASSFFMAIDGTTTICVGEQAVYTIHSNASKIEIDFDEGDGPKIINNIEEIKHSFKKPGNYLIKFRPLNSQGNPIENEAKSIYTTVYSCYLPVNHNLINADY